METPLPTSGLLGSSEIPLVRLARQPRLKGASREIVARACIDSFFFILADTQENQIKSSRSISQEPFFFFKRKHLPLAIIGDALVAM